MGGGLENLPWQWSIVVNFSFSTPPFPFNNFWQLIEVTLPRLILALECFVEFFTRRMEARSQNQLNFFLLLEAQEDLGEGGVVLVIFLPPIVSKFIEFTIIALLK